MHSLYLHLYYCPHTRVRYWPRFYFNFLFYFILFYFIFLFYLFIVKQLLYFINYINFYIWSWYNFIEPPIESLFHLIDLIKVHGQHAMCFILFEGKTINNGP